MGVYFVLCLILLNSSWLVERFFLLFYFFY